MSSPYKTQLLDDDVFTIENFLSVEQCEQLIAFSESLGFEAATVNTIGGHQMLPDWRNNTRVMTDDLERAAQLWERLRPFVPETIDGRKAVGVNERLRFYRYDPGRQFDWHSDGCYQRETNNERSYLTFMVYLNGGVSGGETSFTDDRVTPQFQDFSVTPMAGVVLVFTHALVHKGEPVAEGRKYVLRTDVMYD